MSSNVNKVKINQFQILVLFDQKSRSSFAWKHFGELVLEEGNKRNKIFNDQVYCKQCLIDRQAENGEILFGTAKIKSYNKTVSTGNLMRHLREIHNIKDNAEPKKSMTDFFSITPRPRAAAKPVAASSSAGNVVSVTKADKWLLARDLAIWFCKSLMPFDSVSDEGMIDFFKKYDIIVLTEDLPSRYTVSRGALDDVYETMLSTVKSQIIAESPRHVSVTFDLWTDQYRRLSYITFTLHFLTEDFNLKNFTLSTKLVEGKKTGEKIQEMMNGTVAEFELCDKELHTVTDAGANVKRAFLLAGLDSHLCLGHGLHNLVTVDGIQKVPSVEDLVKKVKKVVKAIRYRAPDLEKEAQKEQLQFLQKLEEASKVLENEEMLGDDDDFSHDSQIFNDEFGDINHLPSIKTATPTRWHSVLIMIESLAHSCNRNPVNNILTKIGQENLKLVQLEWNMLEDLIRFLRKFREAVEILCAQKTVSLNLALVFWSEIKEILDSVTDEERMSIISLKNRMLEKFEHRFPITKNVVLASLLDPRFVGLKEIDVYLEREETTRAAFLAESIRQYVKPCDLKQPENVEVAQGVAESLPGPSSTTQSLLTKLSKKHSSNSNIDPQDSETIQECWRYLASVGPKELEILGGDVLAYWQQKKIVFPGLAALARTILAIPATSTPSERVFSIAGLVVNAKRSRLCPTRVNKIIFVHDNYKHVRND